VTETPKKPIFSLIRTFALADLLTLGNAACGTVAVLLAMQYVATSDPTMMKLALGLLPIALVLDILDGQVARWRRKSSPLGADLDSLADVVSFGVAPAAVGFALGLRGVVDGALLVYFVGCGISRLARYNATVSELSGPSGKVSHYEGTPIPTSLAIVAVLAWAFWHGATGTAMIGGTTSVAGYTLHPFALAYAVSGSLMASTIRFPKL
jgi:CDP-diacylglycerol--serine O-phosphatidyltransferase